VGGSVVGGGWVGVGGWETDCQERRQLMNS
jgi:hypothetical protein